MVSSSKDQKMKSTHFGQFFVHSANPTIKWLFYSHFHDLLRLLCLLLQKTNNLLKLKLRVFKNYHVQCSMLCTRAKKETKITSDHYSCMYTITFTYRQKRFWFESRTRWSCFRVKLQQRGNCQEIQLTGHQTLEYRVRTMDIRH